MPSIFYTLPVDGLVPDGVALIVFDGFRELDGEDVVPLPDLPGVHVTRLRVLAEDGQTLHQLLLPRSATTTTTLQLQQQQQQQHLDWGGASLRKLLVSITLTGSAVAVTRGASSSSPATSILDTMQWYLQFVDLLFYRLFPESYLIPAGTVSSSTIMAPIWMENDPE